MGAIAPLPPLRELPTKGVFYSIFGRSCTTITAVANVALVLTAGQTLALGGSIGESWLTYFSVATFGSVVILRCFAGRFADVAVIAADVHRVYEQHKHDLDQVRGELLELKSAREAESGVLGQVGANVGQLRESLAADELMEQGLLGARRDFEQMQRQWQADILALKQENEALLQQVAALNRELVALRTSVAEAGAAAAAYRGATSTLDADSAQLSARVASLEEAIRAKDAQLDAMQRQNQEMNQQLSELRRGREGLVAAEQAIAQRIEQLRAQIGLLHQAKTELVADIAALRVRASSPAVGDDDDAQLANLMSRLEEGKR